MFYGPKLSTGKCPPSSIDRTTYTIITMNAMSESTRALYFLVLPFKRYVMIETTIHNISGTSYVSSVDASMIYTDF